MTSKTATIGILTCMWLAITGLMVGCGYKPDNRVEESTLNEADFSIVCLDGIQYYIRSVPYKAYMSVKIDPDTLQPGTCER